MIRRIASSRALLAVSLFNLVCCGAESEFAGGPLPKSDPGAVLQDGGKDAPDAAIADSGKPPSTPKDAAADGLKPQEGGAGSTGSAGAAGAAGADNVPDQDASPEPPAPDAASTSCGNGTCEETFGEDCSTCSTDCSCATGLSCNKGQCSSGSCGNGTCDDDETCFSCSADCPCTAGKDYYVSLSGSNSNDGSTPNKAWRTISYAAKHVHPGDTVHIQAGDYGDENVEITTSGTAQSPITFVGYKSTPGDHPKPLTKPGETLDSSVMPLLKGGDRTGVGILVSKAKYLWLRNLQVTLYGYGVRVDQSQFIGVDNVWASKFGAEGDYVGLAVHVTKSDNCILRNLVVTDGRAENISLYSSNHNLVDNCESHSVETDTLKHATDYYIVIYNGSNNEVRNSLAFNHHPTVTPSHFGHGIGVKHGHHNRIVGCTTHGFAKSFYASDAENNGSVSHAYENEFEDCTAYDDGLSTVSTASAFMARDGAYSNTFRNSRSFGHMDMAIYFWDSEGHGSGHDNVFENILIDGAQIAVGLQSGSNNTFRGLVVRNVGTLFYSKGSSPGNKVENSIVTGVSSYTSGSGLGLTVSYSDFFDNGFSPPKGTGIFSQDPLFADPSAGDFHLRSTAGRWNGSLWMKDPATSPCLDSGNPASDFSQEPQPNGGRVNLGIYGNTPQASLSP